MIAKKTKIGAQPTKKSEMPKMTAYAHEVAAELSLVRGVVRILVGLYLEKKVSPFLTCSWMIYVV